MKKALKIFGLALLASSLLFTACKDDEEENNNQQQPEQQQGGQDQSSLRLVFDGTTTTQFGYLQGLYAPKDDTIMVRTRAAVAWTDDGNITMPYVDCMLSNDEDGWLVRYIEYANNATEVNAITEYFEEFTGNWFNYSILNGSSIDDFDATNVTLTYTLLVSMYNAYEYFVEDKDPDQVTMKELDIYATQLRLTRATGSK